MKSKSRIENIYSLTPMQLAILYYYLMDNDTKMFVEQTSISIQADLNEEVFNDALAKLFKRYDALRTIFIYENVDVPRQIVLKDRVAKAKFIDISKLNKHDQDAYLEKVRREERDKPFNLSTDILSRIIVVNKGKNIYEIIWTFHHIIIDGWCLSLLMNDFIKIYSASKEGKELNLEPVTPFYKYVNWLEGRNKEQSELYWKNYLEGYNNVSEVPKFKTSSNEDDLGTLDFEFNKDLTNELNDFARRNELTLSNLIYCLWAVLLKKYNNLDDIVFGRVLSGRDIDIDGIEKMVGVFINTLPLRVCFNETSTFRSILESIKYDFNESMQHSYMGLSDIKRSLKSRQEIIDNIVIIENYPVDNSNNSIDKNGYKILNVEGYERTNYDFNVTVYTDEYLRVKFNYNPDVYDRSFVLEVSKQLLSLAKEMLKNPDMLIKDVSVISEDEMNSLINTYNNSYLEYDSTLTINELFEKQVNNTPNAIALQFKEKELTYKELNNRVNQLANRLLEKGIENGDFVAIMINRSFEMIISMLAVLKAGGAYVPIDPEFPKDRKLYMLSDCKARFLITGNEKIEEELFGVEQIVVSSENFTSEECENIKGKSKSNDIAYVIYTSGSTGKPKGVMIEHKSVNNFIEGITNIIDFKPGKSILALTTISFDIFGLETLLSFCKGLKVILVDEKSQTDPRLLSKIINDNKLDMLQITPSRLQLLLSDDEIEEAFKGLKEIMVGGEAFPNELLDRLKKLTNARIFNMYGPTETTIWSMVKELTNECKITIGKPIANTEVYIMDSYNNILPEGIIGELCIAGDGVARGYLNRDELTKEKFIKHPLYVDKKIYKTGDLARIINKNDTEYIGRVDNQVKIRGFRIEPGEIEKYIIRMEKIKNSVVVDKVAKDGQKYLCAFFCSDEKVNVDSLRENLLQLVPSYMVPAVFVQIESIPLTANGKVDRNKLKNMEIDALKEVPFEEPRNEIEMKLVDIWKDVLKVNNIGINHNFFAIGGDSIKAIQVSSKLMKSGLKLEIKDILKYSTIKSCSEYVIDLNKIRTEKEEKLEFALLPEQKVLINNKVDYYRTVLICNDNGFIYKNVKEALDKLIQNHDALRTKFKKINNEVVQCIYKGNDNYYSFDEFDLRDNEQYEESILQEINNIKDTHYSDINDPLIRICLFKTKLKDYLFIAIDNLIVDEESYRFIIKDFEMLYLSKLDEKEASLIEEKNSYRTWVEKVHEYSNDSKVLEEKSYWREILKEISNIETKDSNVNEMKDVEFNTISIKLSEEQTNKLINDVCNKFNINFDELVLIILGITTMKFNKKQAIAMCIEGNARKQEIDSLDVERTVGCFTILYPVMFNISDSNDIAYQIKEMKENLRCAMNKEISFAALKYLTDDKLTKDLNFEEGKPEILFNYIGNFDNLLNSDDMKVCYKNSEEWIEDSIRKDYELNIDVYVIDGSLNIRFRFNKFKYEEEYMHKLSEKLKAEVKNIISYCLDNNEVYLTPTDFNNSNLTIDDIEILQDLVDDL